MAAYAGAVAGRRVLIDLGCALLTVVLLCWCMAVQPQRAVCPGGWYVNGIRPTGVYECRRAPGGDPRLDGAGGAPDGTIDRPGWYRGRIWCTGGARPIVVLARADSEARTVGCSR